MAGWQASSNADNRPVTIWDLAAFKEQLLQDFRQMVLELKSPPVKQWLKTGEVLQLLGISPGTLQSLRNKGSIPYTKIGGVLYYSREKIEKLMAHRDSLTF